jgi:hypothetical protein
MQVLPIAIATSGLVVLTFSPVSGVVITGNWVLDDRGQLFREVNSVAKHVSRHGVETQSRSWPGSLVGWTTPWTSPVSTVSWMPPCSNASHLLRKPTGPLSARLLVSGCYKFDRAASPDPI